MSRTGVSQRALCMQSLVIDLVHRHSRKQLRFIHLQSTADWIRLGVTHKNEELAECPFGSSLATYRVAFHKHRHVPILLCSFHWIPTNLFSRAFKMYSSAQQSSRKALAAEPGTRASPRSWTVISKVCHICCWGAHCSAQMPTWTAAQMRSDIHSKCCWQHVSVWCLYLSDLEQNKLSSSTGSSLFL